MNMFPVARLIALLVLIPMSPALATSPASKAIACRLAMDGKVMTPAEIFAHWNKNYRKYSPKWIENERAKWNQQVQEFEANARNWVSEKEAELEKTASTQIGARRDELASIEVLYPQGFNTHMFRMREGVRWQVAEYLGRGQERAARNAPARQKDGKVDTVASTVTEFRHLWKEYQEQGALQQEVLDTYFRAPFHHRPLLFELLQTVIQNRATLKQALGGVVWEHTGIATVLLEQAGLRAKPGLIPEGIEATLSADRVGTLQRTSFDAVVRASAAESVMVQDAPVPQAPTQTESFVARQTATQVLQQLKLLGNDGKTQLSPTIDEIDALLSTSALMRLGKLDHEVAFEKKQQNVQKWLGRLSDQQLRSILVAALNGVTFGRFKETFDAMQKDLDKPINEHLHHSRVLVFAGFAERVPDNEIGNEQLAKALLTLLTTSPGMLKSIATALEGVEGLERVKTSKTVQMIWGENEKTLLDAIKKEQGGRDGRFYSAANSFDSRRSNHALRIAIGGAITAGLVSQASNITHYSTIGSEMALEAIKRALGQ